MKGKTLKVVVAVFTVIFAILAIVSAFSGLLLKLYLSREFNMDMKDAASIGIIGGADGPTVIFLSGNIPSGLHTAIFALLAVSGIIYLVVERFKKTPI